MKRQVLERRLDIPAAATRPTNDELDPRRWEYPQSYDDQRRMVAMRLPPVVIRALTWLRDQPRTDGRWRRQSFANIVSELVAAAVKASAPTRLDKKISKRRRA